MDKSSRSFIYSAIDMLKLSIDRNSKLNYVDKNIISNIIETLNDIVAYDWVITPSGEVGRILSIEEDRKKAIVEIDYLYKVEYNLKDLEKYQ
jgi:hypothetical protein